MNTRGAGEGSVSDSQQSGGYNSKVEVRYGTNDAVVQLSAARLIINDTSKFVHTISSSLLLLPFRLLAVALRILGRNCQYLLLGGGKDGAVGYDTINLEQLLNSIRVARRICSHHHCRHRTFMEHRCHPPHLGG